MLTNLPSDFRRELASKSRRPVQLAVFRVGTHIYRLADQPVTIKGAMFSPWVESWGDLVDNSSIEALFGGTSLGIRTCNITVIISPKTNDFI